KVDAGINVLVPDPAVARDGRMPASRVVPREVIAPAGELVKSDDLRSGILSQQAHSRDAGAVRPAFAPGPRAMQHQDRLVFRQVQGAAGAARQEPDAGVRLTPVHLENLGRV